MIVNKTHTEVFDALRVRRPPNLTIVERVPAHEIRDYLYSARMAVNTPQFEGSQNSFLQAAMMGVPIVSLEVAPDGVRSRHSCGVCAAGDRLAMREAVLELSVDDDCADAFSATCRRCGLERHEAEQRITEFEACLEEQRT